MITTVSVEGYELQLDRAYDSDTHMWVSRIDGTRVRVGLDPLGVETSGTLAQLAFAGVGTAVTRGEPFGSMEAEKFVGPLVVPLSGTIASTNPAVVADPGLVHRDPFGDGWLVELDASHLDEEWAALVSGSDAIVAWFAAKLADYRLKGVLAQ